MNQTSKTPLTKFVFHTNKPKAQRIANQFKAGCDRSGYDCSITNRHVPVADRVGVFYGVVPETFAAFRYYMAEGRALYLDNGWLSSPAVPTYRFSWNSVQPFLADMGRQDNWRKETGLVPKINHRPVPGQAMLVLQSRQYYEFLRLGYSRDQWERVVTRMLHGKGWAVDRREKPDTKDPEAITFFEQIERASIVVSMNSASTLKALIYGIPAYCLLDCTPSPLAPVTLPEPGRQAPPDPKAVEGLCARLMSYELTIKDLATGNSVQKILGVPREKRRGYWYANDGT